MANEFIIKNGFHSKGESEITGSLGVTGDITSNSFIKSSGTSTQFLKADGSIDSSTYLTSVGTINLTSGVTGILPVPNGGTGLSTLTSGYIPYGNGTSAFSNNSALLFNESIKQLRITGDSTNDPLRLSNVQTSEDETKTALILASSDGGVQKATLGSNAFNSTAFLTSAFPFSGNARITGSLNVSGSVDIEIPSGSAFTIHEGDASTNYENRLDFYYTQHDPTLEIAARSATSTLLLSKDGGASYSTTLTVLGQLTYKAAGVNYGVQLGTAFKPVTTNQQDLGFYNRRWKNAYLYSGNKLGWGTTNANEHAAFSHTVGTGKVTLESDVYTPSFDLDGPITASAFKGDGSALTNLPASNPFPFTGSANISGSSEIVGSGSGIFSVEGSIGTLFSVDDGLDDVIFAANNVSGTPVIEANADNTVKLGKLGGFGIVISGSTPAPSNTSANIIITGSIQHNGSYGLGVAASATIGRFDASNDVVAFSTSDERLKKYVKNIPNALDKVSQINGVTFQWKKTDDEIKQNVHSFEGKDVGVIAQEIEKVLPEVVTTRDNGYKAVKYEKIIPLLIESIKELKAEIEELKKSK